MYARIFVITQTNSVCVHFFMIFFLSRIGSSTCVCVWSSRWCENIHFPPFAPFLFLSFYLGEIEDQRIRTNERTRRGAKETFESATRIVKKKKREERDDASFVDGSLPPTDDPKSISLLKKIFPRIKKRERVREEKNEKKVRPRERKSYLLRRFFALRARREPFRQSTQHLFF